MVIHESGIQDHEAQKRLGYWEVRDTIGASDGGSWSRPLAHANDISKHDKAPGSSQTSSSSALGLAARVVSFGHKQVQYHQEHGKYLEW
jgi:type II secretory pathway component PulJ